MSNSEELVLNKVYKTDIIGRVRGIYLGVLNRSNEDPRHIIVFKGEYGHPELKSFMSYDLKEECLFIRKEMYDEEISNKCQEKYLEDILNSNGI